MPDLGVSMTDDRVRRLMKRLEGVYAEGMKTAIENNEKAIVKLASLTDEKLEGLDDAAKAAKRKAFANEVLRTEKLRDKIAADIANAGRTAADIVQGEMGNIRGLNFDFTTYSIQRQAGVELDFTIYDRNQLAVLVQKEQSPFTKLAYKRLGEDKKIVKRLQNQLMAGVMNGESQQQLIKRIRGVTGQSVKQAKRVVQSERTRVQSQGRMMGIDEAVKMGVDMDKEWAARMMRTRDSHAALNGKTMAASEKFHTINGYYLDHPGDPDAPGIETIYCYCYLKPKVRSISPALAKHRAWAQDKSFEKYRREQERLRDKKK